MQYYLILYMHVQNNRYIYINVNGGNIESVLHYFIFIIYKQMKHTYKSILFRIDYLRTSL